MSREKEPIHTSQVNHPAPEQSKENKTKHQEESKPATTETNNGSELTIDNITLDDEPEITITIAPDVEDDTDTDNEQSEPVNKEKRRSLITKVILWIGVVAIISSGAVATYYFTQSSNVGYLDFTNDGGESPTSNDPQLLRLSIEIDKLKGDILNLASLPEQFRALKEQNELMKTTIEQLKNELRDEVNAFYAHSKEREQRVASIQSKLSEIINNNKGDRDELEKFKQELNHINETQDAEIERIKTKMGNLKKLLDSQEKPEQSKAKEKSQLSLPKNTKPTPTITKEKKVNQVSTLGHLQLNRIQRLGNQNIAIFSDGVSGAVQVIEGDILGTYRIQSITEDRVTAQDHLGNIYHVRGSFE